MADGTDRVCRKSDFAISGLYDHLDNTDHCKKFRNTSGKPRQGRQCRIGDLLEKCYDRWVSASLAFLTVGVLREAVGSPRVQGFIDLLPTVYAAADASAGFQARSIRDVGTWKHSWGEVVPPACYPKLDDNERFAMTLSLWSDLDSVAVFAYSGAHREALKSRSEWFQSLGLPGYVAWWVPQNHEVDWKEGSERLDHLHAHGSSAFAFNFANPFDSSGNPCRLYRPATDSPE
jgi:hypothetical protein